MNETKTIDVDGVRDRNRKGIKYIGKAFLQKDGTYRCLADVDGSLCLVEVSITKGGR